MPGKPANQTGADHGEPLRMISLIPVHDDNPTRRAPVVNWALIALNVIVFLLSPVADEIPLVSGPPTRADVCEQLGFFRRWAAIPVELTRNDPIDERIEATPRGCLAVEGDTGKIPVLSALTAMFLHGGWLHLLGNMLFLMIFGNNVEDRLGRFRYLLFYLGCGYVATYVFAFANPNSDETLVGASGAIAGVLGAYLVLYPRARVTSLVPFLLFLPFQLPAWIVLGSWFLLQYAYVSGLAMAEGSNVAYLAHVAGFVTGIVGVIALGGLRDRREPPPPRFGLRSGPRSRGW
jgi:membrane associated rhomboid family serine protease